MVWRTLGASRTPPLLVPFQMSRPTPRATALNLGSPLFCLLPMLARWCAASALACVRDVGDGGSEGAADCISSELWSEDVEPKS
jgi:hypothetical protein